MRKLSNRTNMLMFFKVLTRNKYLSFEILRWFVTTHPTKTNYAKTAQFVSQVSNAIDIKLIF